MADVNEPGGNCGLYCSWWLDQSIEERPMLSLSVGWDCGSIWGALRYRIRLLSLVRDHQLMDFILDGSPFQTQAPIPDPRPYISVVYESGGTSSLGAGLVGPLIAPDGSMSSWSSGLPNDRGFGIGFAFASGQSVQVDVGRRLIYTNRARLLDLIGVSRVRFLGYIVAT